MSGPFRILDLGAHDGFVTNFIARRAQAAGVELRIDGIEANPKAVKLFNERLDRDGLKGVCANGLAEQAPEMFEEDSYDAVIAFELLEHAPDVEALLWTAEAMCKPDGRVYISTPNGTFGAGQNPHHLRVWTMVDLFDLIRRRGHVHNALPGPDGVSVVAYTPTQTPKMEVGIYVGPGWEPWNPNDIETKGLGGSETAAVRLADALAREQGCHVTVYGEVAPGAVGQVVYRHHASFDPMDHRDLLIVSRIPEIVDRRVQASKTVLWLHDVDCGDRLTAERASYYDKIMCLSAWHQAHLLDTYPFLAASDLYVTRNGINPAYFEAVEGLERNSHRAVYSSSPDRGLDLLLEWWPEVRERIPDAELYYCYSTVYDAVARQNPLIANFRQRINGLARQEGVTDIGSQNQPSLAGLMLSSGVWLAPSYSTPGGHPFHETFCIGAVEAAAAGCCRVMSAWGALEERDEADFSWWVAQDYDGKPNKEQFIDAIENAMNCKHHVQSQQALDMDWSEVGADMLAAAFQEREALAG